MMNELPLELVAHVMQSMDGWQSSDIAAVTRVCRSWRAIASRYLYRHLHSDDVGPAQELLKVMQRPEYVDFVHSLSLGPRSHGNPFSALDDLHSEVDDEDIDRSWELRPRGHKAFSFGVRIARCCTKLQQLTFHTRISQSIHKDMLALRSSSWISTLPSLIIVTDLPYDSLETFEHFHELLRELTGLRHLQLSPMDVDSVHHSLHACQFSLQTLTLTFDDHNDGYGIRLFDFLLAASTDSLRRLTIQSHQGQPASCSAIARITGMLANLHTLELLGPVTYARPPSIELRALYDTLPRLRHLRLYRREERTFWSDLAAAPFTSTLEQLDVAPKFIYQIPALPSVGRLIFPSLRRMVIAVPVDRHLETLGLSPEEESAARAALVDSAASYAEEAHISLSFGQFSLLIV